MVYSIAYRLSLHVCSTLPLQYVFPNLDPCTEEGIKSARQYTASNCGILYPDDYKGAFCTPRSVVKTITTRSKPTASQVTDETRKLEEEGIGKFTSINQKEKAFYKPLPIEVNKELLLAHVDYDGYNRNFEIDIDTKFITAAQHNRLFRKSPHKDILTDEYGYMDL